jgi:hypothetical protein
MFCAAFPGYDLTTLSGSFVILSRYPLTLAAMPNVSPPAAC